MVVNAAAARAVLNAAAKVADKVDSDAYAAMKADTEIGIEDGERVMVEKQQRVPLWWRQHPNGSYALFVRHGLKPIEFEKGKPAIPVSSLDKLPSVIDTLITAVRNGELDQQLAQTSSKRTAPKSKQAT